MDRLMREGEEAVGLGRETCDLANREEIAGLIGRLQPAEVYYLPAYHHSAEDRVREDDAELYRRSFAVHVTGAIHFLEAIKNESPQTRFFYAASSHVFGRPDSEMQDEGTPLNPENIYGITKTAGMHVCRFYRATHAVFAAAGILYNHESQYRRESFLSQKVIRAARAIRLGLQHELELGDLSARIDWGYAPDYVEAMRRILALPEPDEFVVATGETHSVQDFVECAFRQAGLDWRAHVVEKASLLTKRKMLLCGNAAKLRTGTGWRPSVNFEEMIGLLLAADGSGRAERAEV